VQSDDVLQQPSILTDTVLPSTMADDVHGSPPAGSSCLPLIQSSSAQSEPTFNFSVIGQSAVVQPQGAGVGVGGGDGLGPSARIVAHCSVINSNTSRRNISLVD
jgi:hypothetical protein